MKSTILIANEYGSPEVLRFVEQDLGPVGPGMVRIEVRAAGINPIDARRMSGEFRHAALPQAFGTEFAGVVQSLGNGVTGWAPGDEVLGSGGAFTHATIIDVPAGNLVAKPASMDWAVAGSLAGASQTASTILDELGPISSLLIHGASGGVGSITVQLARALGIDVVATASAANQDYLRSLGASPVVYGQGLTQRLQTIHPALFDASVDMSGTHEAIEASLARVKPDGIVGSISGVPSASPLVRAIWVKRNPVRLKAIAQAVGTGDIKWEVSSRYPFANAPDAYSAILTKHTRGKTVLVF